MSLRKGLFMAIVLLLGAAFMLYSERREEQSDKAITAHGSTRVFPDITETQVEAVRVVNVGQSFALKRKKDDPRFCWRLETPPDAPASAKTAEQLVKLLVNLESENVIPADEVSEDQGVYGLAPPEMFLTLLGSFGERKMSFGKKHPLSGRRYLQPENDGKIYLVDNAAFEMLNQSSYIFRERHPGAFDPAKVTAIVTLNPEKGPMVFRRLNKEGEIDRWQIQAGGKESTADNDLMHRELTELSTFEVKEFVDNAAATLPLLGLSMPKLTLRLMLAPNGNEKAQELTFQIGQGVGLSANEGDTTPKVKAAYYMKFSGEPWVYRFERPFFSDWLQPAEHFLDRTPFDALSGEDLRSVVVTRMANDKTEAFTLKQEAGPDGEMHWKMNADGNQAAEEIPEGRVDEWLEHLFNLKVISYPALGASSGNKFGLETPMLKIVLEPAPPEGGGSASPATQMLLVGNAIEMAGAAPPAEGSQGAKTSSVSPRYGGIVEGSAEPVAVVLSGALIEELNKPPGYFLKK